MPITWNGLWALGFEASVETSATEAVQVGNVLAYRITPLVLSDADQATVVRFLEENVWVPIFSLLPASFSRLVLRWGRTDIPPSGWTQYPSTLQGAAIGERSPSFVAVHVWLRTATRGKRFTGKKRFGPIPTSDIDGDQLTDQAFNNWQEVSQLLTSSWTIQGADGELVVVPVVWSRLLSSGPSVSPVVMVGDIITRVEVLRVLSSNQHRKPTHAKVPQMFRRSDGV